MLSEYHTQEATIDVLPLSCSVRMAMAYHEVEFDYPLGPRFFDKSR